jgi:hypothetical protein
MSAKDDETNGFVEPNKAMVELYWSILRNKPEYKKDYEELQINKEVGTFTDKWSLHDPIDPEEDNINHFYFYPDGVSFMHTESSGVKEGTYLLTIDLDIRRNKTDLKNEIKEIIDKEKEKALGTQKAKNLFGDTRTETAEHYKGLLYVHKLMLEGYKLKPKGYKRSEIIKIAKKERPDFNEDTAKNHYDRLEGLEKLPVPIKKC